MKPQESELRQWSEKNKYLYEVLHMCWEKDIRTHACCGGDKLNDNPYLGILIDDVSMPYIKRIIGRLQNTKDIEMSASVRKRDERVFPEDECKAFVVYTQTSNSCEVFYKIGQALQDDSQIEITNRDAKELYRGVKMLHEKPYSEILENAQRSSMFSSHFTNVSMDLVLYKQYDRSLLYKFGRLPIIGKIIGKFFPQLEDGIREYKHLENRYNTIQTDYEPELAEEIAYKVEGIDKYSLSTEKRKKELDKEME